MKPKNAIKKIRLKGISFFVLVSFIMPALAIAAPKKPKKPAPQCIFLPTVKKTDVIDNQTILFYLSGKKIKKMSLTRKCSSLKFYKFFSYKVSTNKLCAGTDHIVTRTGNPCFIKSIEDYAPPKKNRAVNDRPVLKKYKQ